MDYKQAVQFHKAAEAYGSILGLDSIQALLKELGDIWRALRIVHIAGTNGKGSVSCFMASALLRAGYRTGQYTSPAVFDLRESYQIDGQWISREAYASCMEEVAAACGKMTRRGLRHPTVFEVDTALAFLWFYRQKCDIVLLEAGMGGETDATNVIERPLCSVLTPIGMDHMQFLGNSLAQIARVKAGIIKTGCPVVTAIQPPEAKEAIEQTAKTRRAACYQTLPITDSWVEGRTLCYRHPSLGTLRLSMTGSYQVENSALALQTLFLLRECGYPMEDDAIKRGIETAAWAGRFERIGDAPLFYIDGAHNLEAAQALKNSLTQNFPDMTRIGIMGVMADKPYREMLSVLLPCFERIYTVTPENARALPAETLAAKIRDSGVLATAQTSVWDAVRLANETAKKANGQAMVTAFGSLYYLRKVKRALYEITENR